MQRLDKRRLRKFYEEEAKRIAHQESMYLKGDKYKLWWHRKRLKYVISFLTEVFKEHHGRTFADIGCAEGYYLGYITSVRDDVFCVGADIARDYIEKAKINVKKPNADFIVCTLENLPFRENCFDVVLCSEVLEHMPDYQKALVELYRASRRHLVISFPGHSYVYKVASKAGSLKKMVDNILPRVGHISEVTVDDMESFAKTRKASVEIRIGGALPVELYKFVCSVRLIDAIDNVLCKILGRLESTDYATMHVIKMTKEENGEERLWLTKSMK